MKNDLHILRYINNILPKYNKELNPYLLIIISNWNKISPKWFLYSYVIKIKWQKNQAVLYIKIRNLSIKPLILHDKKHIIENANAYIGYQCIVDIRIIH